MNKNKRTCKWCSKSLVAIGTSRANGKANHSDWSTRKYHKACYKEKYYKRQLIKYEIRQWGQLMECWYSYDQGILTDQDAQHLFYYLDKESKIDKKGYIDVSNDDYFKYYDILYTAERFCRTVKTEQLSKFEEFVLSYF